jgi:8-oxo-dGTP diphosphatase
MNTRVIALVAAFNNNGELLLLKRPDDTHCGGLWSFPGGKVEAGETPLNASVRELKEETGLSGTLWRHLGKGSHSYPDQTLSFLFFVCHCPDISELSSESTHVWCKLDELEKFPMPEANTELLPMLSIAEIEEYSGSF